MVLVALHLSTMVCVLAAVSCAHDRPRRTSEPTASVPVSTQKESLTPAQRKISPLLLSEISRYPAPSGPGVVKIDERQRALVDIRAAVTPSLLARVKALDGIVVSSYPAYDSTIAWIPLLKLEQLAADSEVRFVEPAVDPMLNSTQPAKKP